MDSLNHGKYSTYFNHKCRCDLCKRAASEYRKSQRSRGLPEGDKRHGTTNGYFGWGCRCEGCVSAARGYTASQSDVRRNRVLSKAYNLTSEEWDVKFENQGRRCASCGDEPKADSTKRFHVDHNHTTGQVRGILCHHCNVALGHLKEDRRRMEALIEYIESYELF